MRVYYDGRMDLEKWFNARCEVDPNARSYSTELYLDFLAFFGYRTLLERVRAGLSQKRFTQALLAKYPCAIQKSSRRRIVGIRFTRPGDEDL